MSIFISKVCVFDLVNTADLTLTHPASPKISIYVIYILWKIKSQIKSNIKGVILQLVLSREDKREQLVGCGGDCFDAYETAGSWFYWIQTVYQLQFSTFIRQKLGDWIGWTCAEKTKVCSIFSLSIYFSGRIYLRII